MDERFIPEDFPDTSPAERFERYAWCEGLARWFATKCQNNEGGKYSGLTRGAIVAQYRLRLQGQRAAFGNLSPAEADWVMNECARVWAARSA
jgi:hypothetical protein